MAESLVGIGLYTPSEAGRLLDVPAGKIRRWLSGHEANGTYYPALWSPQVDLDDDTLHLGFRDLMELRTAHLFLREGISAQAIRKAIGIAREMIGDDRPLSTRRLKTDGKTIFLEVATTQDEPRLLDLLKRQYAFKRIVDASLRDVEFSGNEPSKWYVGSRGSGVVVDPTRSFGQPIEEQTGIPTAVLAAAARASGNVARTASEWEVPKRAVERALQFETDRTPKAA